jgi:hypothetical protein
MAPEAEVAVAGCACALALALVGLAVEAPDAPVTESAVVLGYAVVSVWLIAINCCRLFTFTSWLMYSLGSVVAVGSWFFISVTNNVRKSFAEIVAELALELLVPLLAPGVAAAAACGTAVVPVCACPAK